jgi:DNA-binding transcriptional regulator YiaG
MRKETEKIYRECLKRLAENVKYIRTQKVKLSQERFAYNCDTTLSAISCMERAKGSDMYTIAKVSAYTGWAVSDLIG